MESQTLFFQEAWERTISLTDKEEIIKLFERSSSERKPGEVSFIPFRVALNYKGDILATVLIQNEVNSKVELLDFSLSLFDKEGYIATESFSYSNIALPPNSTMPWTFIFPREKLARDYIDLHDWNVCWNEQ